MSRYTVRIGSAFALTALLLAGVYAPARAAGNVPFVFQRKRITISRLISQSGGRAVAIDDPGLRTLFAQIGATLTWQPGSRYVLVTTAEPVVISFSMGDTRYDVGPVTENAAFAPFMLDGHPYVPFEALMRALDLSVKSAGPVNLLQPELATLDVESDGGGTKLVAHGGMPLDGRIVSQSANRVVVAFDGVGSALPASRSLSGGPVQRIDARTEGTPANPRAVVTLYLAPGTTHSAPGTDDQRDFTLGFNGTPAAQSAAPAAEQTIAQTAPEPAETAAAVSATPLPSPPPASGAQVTAVDTQMQNGALTVHVAVSGNAVYDWHRLRPPDNRFWIDIQGARLSMPPSDQPVTGPATDVRVHQDNPTTVRVAISLSDFEQLSVAPDSGGVTITVQNALAGAGVARSGSGSTGENPVAAVAAAPSPSDGSGYWKYSPRPSPSAYAAANPRLIVLDPGHGGSDAGSVHGGMVEKTITLQISKRVRDILISRGWEVMMTRDTDRDVYAPDDTATQELQARDNVANANGARLFVSIHLNAYINAGPHGATVYWYKPSDLALAQAIDKRIASEVNVANDGIVRDMLYVVHHANMPATLIEAAFDSNPDDRTLLWNPQWQQKMATAIADGIGDYAGSPPAASAASGQ